MSWNEIKNRIQPFKNDLDNATTDSQISNLVTGMNQAIGRFSAKAGISQNPTEDVDYQQAQEKFAILAILQRNYTALNQYLTSNLRNLTSGADIQGKLREAGELKQSIAKLEKELQDSKQDADTSKTRQDTVEKVAQNVSWYQGFSGKIGFLNPLKLTSIPFLIGFGILFLFFSGLVLKDFFSPSMGLESFNNTSSGSILDTFSDSRFYAVMAGITFISVILSILAYMGYLGNRN